MRSQKRVEEDSVTDKLCWTPYKCCCTILLSLAVRCTHTDTPLYTDTHIHKGTSAVVLLTLDMRCRITMNDINNSYIKSIFWFNVIITQALLGYFYVRTPIARRALSRPVCRTVRISTYERFDYTVFITIIFITIIEAPLPKY